MSFCFITFKDADCLSKIAIDALNSPLTLSVVYLDAHFQSLRWIIQNFIKIRFNDDVVTRCQAAQAATILQLTVNCEF